MDSSSNKSECDSARAGIAPPKVLGTTSNIFLSIHNSPSVSGWSMRTGGLRRGRPWPRGVVIAAVAATTTTTATTTATETTAKSKAQTTTASSPHPPQPRAFSPLSRVRRRRPRRHRLLAWIMLMPMIVIGRRRGVIMPVRLLLLLWLVNHSSTEKKRAYRKGTDDAFVSSHTRAKHAFLKIKILWRTRSR
jgi:hypothetical protein